MKFDHEIDAAKFLLRESTSFLTESGVNFVVVGGWSAFLFNSKKYGHPGTFDVDILLDEVSLDDGTFDEAAEKLLDTGYMRAPKNLYQAHRILEIGSEKFVFHVDFLNKRDPGNAIDLVGGKGRMRSIYTDAMRAVFKYGDYRYHDDFKNVRFPSPYTFIATKAAAARVKKRTRDAYDIFITAADQDPVELKKIWFGLCQRDGLFVDANQAILDALNSGDAIYKIKKHLSEMQHKNGLSIMQDDSEIEMAFNFLNHN